jgi:uncharacterized protein (UPF0548 family)
VTLTYPEIGATQHGPLPAGYDHVTRHARIGDDFETARAALRRWQPQRGAGLRVRTDATEPSVGVRFATGLGIGPVRLWAPCEVVWVVDEPKSYGFGFGTLSGHPERGEEGFRLTVDDSGAVWFDVRAFSRPARWWVKLGHPFARLLQARVTDRYVRAMTSSR